MPTQLTEESEPVNILWYGDGGSGKTTDLVHLALLKPEGKLWIANAESGVKARALKQFGIPLERVEMFPDANQGEKLDYDGLEGEWQRIREALHEDPDSYIGVGWDSVTEIQQAMKDNEVVRSIQKAARRGQERDPFIVDQDNWRTINEQCRSLIRKFRDLPCHFGATALERREQDNDGKVIYMPAVTPGLQNDLIGWMDVICHTDTIWIPGEDDALEENFMGLFRNQGKYRGKDRFKVLPKQLINPTYDRVVGYIEGDLTLEDDEQMKALRRRLEAQERAAA